MASFWRIELFGGLRISRGERSFAFLQAPKAGLLLAYLAYFPRHPQPRELLLELLWPESDPDTSRHNLRSLVHAVRRQLEPAAPAAEPLLVAERAALHLNPAAFGTDVAEFAAALQQAARTADPSERARQFAAAVELYRGELLAGFYDPWVLTERQRLEEQYLGALQQLVLALEESGDPEQAIEYARRAVRVDPLREEAHYDLMRLYAAAGQPSATLRQYQELERLLREELGESPSAATRALAEELQDTARTVVAARSAPLALAAPASTAPPSPVPEHPAPPATPAGPPIVAPSPPPLPAQFTRFFGREEEIAQVAAMLRVAETRLVTITGPGGSGKTRLAVAVAGRLQGEFEGAVWFIPLAEVTDSRRIGEVIRDAMERPASPGGEPLEQVVAALAQQRALLILDNFEQLAESGARLVRQLLERVRSLTCLVTSRQRLELEGEQEFVVLPLPTPAAFHPARRQPPSSGPGEEPETAAPVHPRHLTPHALLQYPSVALFVDRARAARPSFELTAQNAAAVAQLCDRLEGLPLALELAAARAGALAPQQMLDRLARRFDFLVSPRRDISARHRTLRAALEWSFQLLAPELQRFFARLSIFRGSFSLEAAEAVCAVESGEPPERGEGALEPLEQLRQWSLVLTEEADPGSTLRYRLLETLREFAAEQLSPAVQADLARRHSDYFQALADDRLSLVDGRWPNEERRKQWLTLIDTEYDNLRPALEWALVAEPRSALELASSLVQYWWIRGYWAEALEFLPRVARWQSEDTTVLRARALLHAGDLARQLGQYPQARGLLEEAAALGRAMGDSECIGAALCNLGEVAMEQADYEQARRLFQESLEARRSLRSRINQVWSLAALGDVDRAQGHYDRARAFYEESLAICREWGNQRYTAQRLRDLGLVAHHQRDGKTAQNLLSESLAIFREYGDRIGISLALKTLGDLALSRAEYPSARAYYQESLTLLRDLGHRKGVAAGLEGLAQLIQGEQRHPEGLRRAAQLFGAAQTIRAALGAPLPPNEQPEHEAQIGALREALGETLFTAAWEEGHALSWDRAAALALGEE
jgi:predicted ATPase/DNA-binding SARP family transcriptional activator